MTSQYIPVQLFGGAITTVLPDHLFDASTLRQVPDSQEVWISKINDLSFILEVLQLVTESGAGDSLKAGIEYHFKALASDNDAISSDILSLVVPPGPSSSIPGSTSAPAQLIGHQKVAKFNRPDSEADTVLVQLALWRIPQKNSDLVLSVNWPQRADDVGGQGEKAAREAFANAVASLSIVDYNLFAG